MVTAIAVPIFLTRFASEVHTSPPSERVARRGLTTNSSRACAAIVAAKRRKTKTASLGITEIRPSAPSSLTNTRCIQAAMATKVAVPNRPCQASLLAPAPGMRFFSSGYFLKADEQKLMTMTRMMLPDTQQTVEIIGPAMGPKRDHRPKYHGPVKRSEAMHRHMKA